MKKGLAVYGSTGTIGQNTLAIVRAFADRFSVVSLAAGRNLDALRPQIREFSPRVVAVSEERDAATLRTEFPEIECLSAEAGWRAGIEVPGVDVVVMGIVGFAALEPSLHAVRRGKTIALANKESLVVAGPLMKQALRESAAKVIPVDSEHNALFQLLEGTPREQVSTIVLTASGGPLLKKPDLPLEDVTPEIAIAHPNWRMGPKISVDSATLMNKGLELIEAHYLFDFRPEAIEVWVHPQSLVHGALWLKDNSCLAQLTKPDMRSSIGHAMAYPDRLPSVIEKLSLKDLSRLEFLEPDTTRFPCLRIAREALSAGPSHLVALNAANEIAVERFLKGEILFPHIPRVIQEVLERHRATPLPTLEDVLAVDRLSRDAAKQYPGR